MPLISDSYNQGFGRGFQLHEVFLRSIECNVGICLKNEKIQMQLPNRTAISNTSSGKPDGGRRRR